MNSVDRELYAREIFQCVRFCEVEAFSRGVLMIVRRVCETVGVRRRKMRGRFAHLTVTTGGCEGMAGTRLAGLRWVVHSVTMPHPQVAAFMGLKRKQCCFKPTVTSSRRKSGPSMRGC